MALNLRPFDDEEAATLEFGGKPPPPRPGRRLFGDIPNRRRWANDVADWIERGRASAVEIGDLEHIRRPLIQNVDTIVEALREYADRRPGLLGALRSWWRHG